MPPDRLQHNLILAWLWIYNTAKRAGKRVIEYAAAAYSSFSLIGCFILCAGAADWEAHRKLHFLSAKLWSHWVPGLLTPSPIYNDSLITYIIIILSMVSALGLKWALVLLPRVHAVIRRILAFLAVPMLALSIFMMIAPSIPLPSVCAFFAFFLLLPDSFPFLMKARNFLAKPPRALYFLKKSSPVMLLGLILLALCITAKTWYPVQISNDYYELQDTVLLSPGAPNEQPQIASRATIIDCLEALRLGTINNKNDKDGPHCDLKLTAAQLEAYRIPVIMTGERNVLGGRIFYHHSYYFVPAIHFLKYGILSPIPYLYGVGNILFHALLMYYTSPTLTGYFNTFPVSPLVGFLAITLLVWYAARSLLATIAGAAVLLIAFYGMSFEYIELAPGLSPLRYGGVAVQSASIFFVFRGSPRWRPAAVIAALVFSLFWNMEFAFLGLVGQLLALMSPALRITFLRRIIFIVCMAVSALAMVLAIGYLTRGYPAAIQAGLFGISVPLITSTALLFAFYGVTLTLIGILIFGATRFSEGEQAARLCVLPILALIIIKYLYYTVPVHLFFSLVFIAPLSLVYFNWVPERQKTTSLWDKRWPIDTALSVILAVVCFANTLFYYHEAKHFLAMTLDPFEKQLWTELGEETPFAAPKKPLMDRIEAIASQIKPEDTVFFLSPFDHLLSFYANPARYCGHFEVFTNLVTDGLVDSALECVKSSPHVLIVYDEAVTAPCPTEWRAAYYDTPSCYNKKKLFATEQGVMATLRPSLVLVKKIGGLSFYRPYTQVKPQGAPATSSP